MIYGDISYFLPDNWTSFDLLTFRREWISGSFTVCKNTSFINALYASSLSVRHVFSAPKFLGFDECFGLFSDLAGRNDPSFILKIDRKQSFSWLVQDASSHGALKLYQETCIKESLPPGFTL